MSIEKTSGFNGPRKRIPYEVRGNSFSSSLPAEPARDSNAGAKREWFGVFRRRQDQQQASQPGELVPGASAVPIKKAEEPRNNVREVRRAEKEAPERLRLIQPEDVQTMIDKGWFEDWNRIKGLKGDVLNERTVPAVWTDETRKKFKDEVLMPFYFPEGLVHIVATDEKGAFMREVDVERQSYVFTWKGKLKAARSFLSNDPWASEDTFNNPKFKMAHAQMLISAPGKENEHKGYATGLCAYFHEEVFDRQGYTQLITWVNREDIDYGLQEQMFEKMGYQEQRGSKGKLTINPTDPSRRTKMRKYWLTPKKLEENLITKDNTWLRWEKKKGDLLVEEAGGQSSR